MKYLEMQEDENNNQLVAVMFTDNDILLIIRKNTKRIIGILSEYQDRMIANICI